MTSIYLMLDVMRIKWRLKPILTNIEMVGNNVKWWKNVVSYSIHAVYCMLSADPRLRQVLNSNGGWELSSMYVWEKVFIFFFGIAFYMKSRWRITIHWAPTASMPPGHLFQSHSGEVVALGGVAIWLENGVNKVRSYVSFPRVNILEVLHICYSTRHCL